MPITWSHEAEDSLFDILKYYELEVSSDLANSIEDRIIKQVDALNGFEMSIPQSQIFHDTRKLVISKLPYIAFIREVSKGQWQVVDIVHTSRKLPK